MKKGRSKRKSGKYYTPLTIAMSVAALFVVWWSMQQTPARTSGTIATAPTTKLAINQLVTHTTNDSLVYNTDGSYTLQYSPHYRSAIWVAYKLTKRDIQGKAGRNSSFRPDSTLSARGFRVASNSDYRNSGYDKGHLLPSADRQSSLQANRATFLLSNCSPQLPKLNRGTWKSLEESIRTLTRSHDTIYIVTGAKLHSGLPRIGKNRITVPELFFKAVVARRGDSLISYCYIMPNRADIDSSIDRYRVTIDSIENLTGLDLFPGIK